MELSMEERLNALQMADLGTARREIISTVDTKRPDRTRLEDIEASRMSNIAGSEAQRLAQANKKQLNKWSNMYKMVGDSDDLEKLDNLMDGQSHRAQLMAKVQDTGSLMYSKSFPKSGKLSYTAATRGAQSSGRGGGVIGTRTRASKYTSVRVTSHPPGVKLGHHPAQGFSSRTHHLDPALGPNEDFYKNSREQNKKAKEKSKGINKAQGQPTPRPKRVPSTTDFSQVLSGPDEFMSAARKLVMSRAPSAVSSQPESVSDGHPLTSTKGRKQPTSGQETNTQQPISSRVVEPSDFMSAARSMAMTRAPSVASTPPASVSGSHRPDSTKQGQQPTSGQNAKPQKPTPSHQIVPQRTSAIKPGTSVPQVPASPRTPIKGNGQEIPSAPKSLRSSVAGRPHSKTASGPTVAGKPQYKVPATKSPQPPQAQEPTPQKAKGPETGLLLDFSSSPSSDGGISARLSKMTLSPGITELMGLDFQSDSQSYSTLQQETLRPPPGLFKPEKKIDFDQYVTEKTANVANSMGLETPQMTLRAPTGLALEMKTSCVSEQRQATSEEKGTQHISLETPKRTLPPPPGLGPPQKEVNFDNVLTDKNEKDLNDMDPEASLATAKDEKIESYRHEISEINEFIKSRSLGSLVTRRFKHLILELEEKIREGLQRPVDTSAAHSGGNRDQEVADESQVSTPTEISANASSTLKSEEPKVKSKKSEPSLASSTTIDEGENQQSSKRVTSRAQKFPSVLRAAVTAPPFIPDRKASFTEYRSPQSSISSDTTIFHQAQSFASDYADTTTRHAIDASNHIIGNHLLPGHHSQESSVSESRERHLNVRANLALEIPTQSFGVPNGSIASFKGFSSGASPTFSQKAKLVGSSNASDCSDIFMTPEKVTASGPTPADSLHAWENDPGLIKKEGSVHAPFTSHGTTSANTTRSASSARPQHITTSNPAGVVSGSTAQSRYASTQPQGVTTNNPAGASSRAMAQSRYSLTLSQHSAPPTSGVASSELKESIHAPK